MPKSISFKSKKTNLLTKELFIGFAVGVLCTALGIFVYLSFINKDTVPPTNVMSSLNPDNLKCRKDCGFTWAECTRPCAPLGRDEAKACIKACDQTRNQCQIQCNIYYPRSN